MCRHITSVKSYDSLTGCLTDPLNMLCNNASEQLLAKDEMDSLVAEILKTGKSRSS